MICIRYEAYTASVPDEGGRDGLCSNRYSLHSDASDCLRRLYCGRPSQIFVYFNVYDV